MKINSTLLMLGLFLSIQVSFSQNLTNLSIDILQKESTVEIVITSQEPFYIGAQSHVLHIADKTFAKNSYTSVDGNSVMVFPIPIQEFEQLPDNVEMVLVYGKQQVRLSDESDKQKSQNKPRYTGKHWTLGKLEKSQLRK